MKSTFLSTARLAVTTIFTFPTIAMAWQPGTYPAKPLRMTTSGFAVDNQDRNDVIAFWQAVYQASEGYETRVDWTGNYKGNNGTTSADFVDDVERRINYFRAMCGVPPDASVNSGSKVLIGDSDAFKPAASTLKSTASQNAALMLIRSYNSTTGAVPALTHNPPNSVDGWSASAWNASAHGNFSFGAYGPGAINEYLVEESSSTAMTSSWNSLVGHRRWSLFPGATDFATGDQPGSSVSVPPTNVFYVIQKPAEIADTTGQGFVTYPPAGFFPANINSKFWSISRKDADFTFATVEMRNGNGKAIPVSNVQRDNSYGDPAIVWEASPAAAANSVAGDTVFTVKVTGIAGTGIPTSLNYSVTLINPDLLLSNQQLTGPSSIISGNTGIYTFTPPPGAEALQVAAFIRNSTSWKEDAEADARVIDGTDESYPLIVKPSSFAGFGSVAGTSSFRLTFHTPYDLIKRSRPEQSFEIDRNIIANSNAKLKFKYRRGYMTTDSSLAVETSADDGVTWKVLGDPITGVSNTKYDTAVSSASLALTPSADSVRIRFRYFTTGGAIFTHDASPTLPTGIFIDEITTTNCNLLEVEKTNTLSATAANFAFKSKTAGIALVPGTKWQLKLRTKLGGKWFPYGPGKAVTITAP